MIFANSVVNHNRLGGRALKEDAVISINEGEGWFHDITYIDASTSPRANRCKQFESMSLFRVCRAFVCTTNSYGVHRHAAIENTWHLQDSFKHIHLIVPLSVSSHICSFVLLPAYGFDVTFRI